MLCTNAAALTSDEQEKLLISSESAEIDRKAGTSTYRTTVKVDNGTTHVTGEALTTYNDKNGRLVEIVVEGSPSEKAHYWTVTELNKPELHAKANLIKYYPQKRYIILIGDANIEQGTDSISGPLLEYDVEKQRLLAKKAPNAQGQSARTTIVIQPNNEAGNGLAPLSGNKTK